MNPQAATAVLPPRSRSEASGSILIAFPQPAQPAGQPSPKRNFPMLRTLTQRLDAVLSTLAMFGMLSPLVLASVMFVVTSR
jgi:hypothetical protein